VRRAGDLEGAHPCDESHEHHRAADFWRHPGIFSQLRSGYDTKVQDWCLSVAVAIFDRWLRVEKTDHICEYRVEVARSTGARELCASGGKSGAARDQPGFARCRARSEPSATRPELSRALGLQVDRGGNCGA